MSAGNRTSIAEDRTLVREGLRLRIQTDPAFERAVENGRIPVHPSHPP
jgi:hypothetical protein